MGNLMNSDSVCFDIFCSNIKNADRRVGFLTDRIRDIQNKNIKKGVGKRGISGKITLSKKIVNSITQEESSADSPLEELSDSALFSEEELIEEPNKI